MITSDQTNILLSKGSYETKEQEIVSKLLETTNAYLLKIKTSNFGTRQVKSVFETDTKGFNKALRLPSLFGTNTFQDFTSTIIKKEKSPSTILILLNGIKENGFDPNYEILKALEVFSENSKIKNTAKRRFLVCHVMIKMSGKLNRAHEVYNERKSEKFCSK